MRNWKAVLFPFVLFFSLSGAGMLQTAMDPSGGSAAGGGCAPPGGGGFMQQQNNAMRGSGMRRTYESPQEDVHAAALYVMSRYTNGWTVQDNGGSINASMNSGFIHIGKTIMFSPGLADGTTDVEVVTTGTAMNAEQRMQDENSVLNFLNDALIARRASANKGRGNGFEPPARDEAPRVRESEVDKIGKFTDKEREDDFAVVIGIEKYQNVPAAQFAEHDARTMQKYFVALGVPEENVILLTGQKATRTGLVKYVEEWLPRNVTPKSHVYFYYSGHGAPDPADGSAYLVPWDGDASFLKSSAYPVSKLYEKLGALKAKQVVVMLDSCFSGAGGRSVIAKGARPLVNVTDTQVPQAANLSVLSASSGEQISGAKEDEGHGLFTYFLLKGMKGAADPEDTGHLTLDTLYNYVKKSVERAARRDNREQTPQLHAADPKLALY